jgi:hypothetical protein
MTAKVSLRLYGPYLRLNPSHGLYGLLSYELHVQR